MFCHQRIYVLDKLYKVYIVKSLRDQEETQDHDATFKIFGVFKLQMYRRRPRKCRTSIELS